MATFGLTRKEFLKLTPIEFYLALKHQDILELARVRPIAEAIRMEAWWLVNVQLGKNKKIKKKEKIMSFSWDPVPKPQTVEEMRAKLKFIAAATANRKRRKRPVTKAPKVVQEKKKA